MPPSLVGALRRSRRSQEAYPFAKEIQDVAGQRRRAARSRPAYQNLSIVISHAVSPPARIDPREHGEEHGRADLKDALESKGLVP